MDANILRRLIILSVLKVKCALMRRISDIVITFGIKSVWHINTLCPQDNSPKACRLIIHVFFISILDLMFLENGVKLL